MQKEIISDKQGILLIFFFFIGSSSIFAQGLEAKKDLWLAFMLGIVMVFPMVLIYARLHHIFPNQDLFDILEICFGKLLGKIMIVYYTWSVYFIASDILVNYGQFFKVVSLSDTPQIVPIIMFTILCIWAIKEGIEVLGRFSEIFFIVPVLTLLLIILLLIPNMDINHIRPMLQRGFQPVLEGAFSVFTFPFAQIVVFTMVLTNFQIKESSYKVYTIGVLMGAGYLFILSLTNILVLGAEIAETVYYPSYAAVSRIHVTDIIDRMEIVLTIVFVLGGVIKISLLLLCTCKGITKLCGCKNYRWIVIPISLLTINLAFFQYDSVMYYFEFNREIWPYYHLPFHLIFPMILWIVAEIKNKKGKNNI
ncbi:endospore germination permease [Clostridiaceae bacterium 35-E11]